MSTEHLRPKETLKNPESLFIIAHLATWGGIGDFVALTTVAARLKRAGIQHVGLGHKNTETLRQMVSLIPFGTIDFQPLPAQLFDSELSQHHPFLRLLRFGSSSGFQYKLLAFETIAIVGAEEIRFLPKSPFLHDRLSFFPEDPASQNQSLVDFCALQLGEYCGVAHRLDHKPLEFSIPQHHKDFLSWWASAKENKLDLESPYLVINLGTGRAEKTWPFDRFLGLGKQLQQKTKIPIVFINLPISPNDPQQWQSFTAMLENPWVHCLFSAEIGQVAALIERAEGYIGGDTGFTHIAAALGTRFVEVCRKDALPVWKPITKGQKLEIISGEKIEDIALEQVLDATKTFLKF